MTADEKVERMAEISMFASKIGNLVLNDPLNLSDCAFACGVALSGIIQAGKNKGVDFPDKAELDLAIQFIKGLAATTAVMIRDK